MARVLQFPGSGDVDILTSIDDLEEQLLLIERAGRTCYQSERGEISIESASRFVRMLLRRGHESVIEHTIMTVRFRGFSRGLTHEFVRHRLASYSQESTRYVDYAKGGDNPDIEGFELRCVAPPHRDINKPIDLGDGRAMSTQEMFDQTELFYRALRRAGWPPEDARQILPIGVCSEIVASANWREWRHIFELRTGKRAHWEIRSAMTRLLVMVQGLVPVIFDDFVKAGVDKNGIPFFEQDPSVFERNE